MKKFEGQALSWGLTDGVVELALHREPCNEIGLLTLEELERFAAALEKVKSEAHALIIYSSLKCGFSAGADLKELFRISQEMDRDEAVKGVRNYLERIHRVMNAIDASPLTTIAAVHGVTFGGGFELALVCDLIIADKMARFCFPELRLGLIPGFGGIPRLKRDLGNANGPKLQRDEGAASWLGQSDGGGRRIVESGAGHGASVKEIRPAHRDGGEGVHQTDSI